MSANITNPRTISVVGLGVAETALLTQEALAALQSAQLIIGSERQLLTIKAHLSDDAYHSKVALMPKLAALKSLIVRAQAVVVLGSGDPLFYGIGSWITKHCDDAQVQFFPAVSSITQACHCLGVAQQDIVVLSLHGRPLAKLKQALKAQRTLLVLTDKHSQPQHIAEICLQTGFTDARIIVAERLGYSDQKITHFTVEALLSGEWQFDALHVSFIECGRNGGYLPEFPGIKDTDFETGELGSKGMISKREVRLAILSLLQPANDDVIWDIGAGCGGVSVELAYWQPKASIYAIEHHQARFDCLIHNQQKFGVVSNLYPTWGRAPNALTSLPAANKIFIGGSDGELPHLLETLWQQLPAGGQILVSAVMEKTKSQCLAFYEQRENQHDSELETLQIAVSKSRSLAEQLAYQPALPVSLFSFTKCNLKPCNKGSESE
ncbi:precorrin-6y C5,15-methyltransferase (decarboxylating) subunit CbiE [Vibrio sp. RC27]